MKGITKKQRSWFGRGSAFVAAVLVAVVCVFGTFSPVNVKAAGENASGSTKLDGVEFSYAYDVQRTPAYPKKGDVIRAYGLDTPYIAGEGKGTATQGKWTLTNIGTYSGIKGTSANSEALADIIAVCVERYGLVNEDSVIVHELKDNGKHIAYGVAVAYDSVNGYVVFLGDALLGGAGYLISAKEQASDVEIIANLDITDWVATDTNTVVEAPSIKVQPTEASVKAGETAAFSIEANGTSLTYQWQIDRNDGNGFVNIENANSNSYTTSTVDSSCNGFKYQCVVSNSAGSVTSDTVILTVTAEKVEQPITDSVDQGTDKKDNQTGNTNNAQDNTVSNKDVEVKKVSESTNPAVTTSDNKTTQTDNTNTVIKTSAPKTADTGSTGMWMVILCSSIACLAGVMLNKKRVATFK